MSLPNQYHKQGQKRKKISPASQPNKIPYLQLPNEKVYLDKPERDFAYRKGCCGSGAYFCSNGKYSRSTDLRSPGKANWHRTFRTGWDLQYDRAMLGWTCPWLTQPVMSCPGSAPWILNTAFLTIGGKALKLRWGPNYADYLQDEYVDIWLGENLIWTNSPTMQRRTTLRGNSKNRCVIENQDMQLHTVSYCLASQDPLNPNPELRMRDLPPTKTRNWMHPQLNRSDLWAKVTELQMEDGQPLYAALAQVRNQGFPDQKMGYAWLGLCADSDGDCIGPLPQPLSLVVTYYRWVWRGLDLRIGHSPLVLYHQLLKGRVVQRDPDSPPSCSSSCHKRPKKLNPPVSHLAQHSRPSWMSRSHIFNMGEFKGLGGAQT
ncbi:hypothetical protein VZT92_022916 [Zoarces viviparus]|uniref:Uncharacterized protein n=1 Tax=Zoarces viviparus TaxID=48416 RepID=A0AAW1E786_ZOAVI